MEKLSEIEIAIIKQASNGFRTPNRYKIGINNKINEKIDNNETEFIDKECSLMFEFMAHYASSEFDQDVVNGLRDKLRVYKFPNDTNKA